MKYHVTAVPSKFFPVRCACILPLIAAAVLAIIPATSRAQDVYLTYYSFDYAGEFDLSTGLPVAGFAPISVPVPNGIALSGTTLYIANTAGAIATYNATTGAPINPAFVSLPGEGPQGVTVSNNILYVTTAYVNEVTAYNASTGAPLPGFNSITGLSNPAATTVSGTDLYVSNGDGNSVGLYNAQTGAAINANLITSGLVEPWDMVVSGTDLFVADRFGDAVGEFNATTGDPINTSFITGVDGPIGMALSGNDLYVTNGFDNLVTAYDTTTGNPVPVTSPLVPGGLQSIALASSAVPDTGSCLVLSLIGFGTLFFFNKHKLKAH